MAPRVIVEQIVSDVSAYYTMQRELSVDEYMLHRYDLLSTYFTGPALSEMRVNENNRAQYMQNRAGTFTVMVRGFSPDGYTVKVGVVKRGWIYDVYDVTTRELVKRGVVEKDTLSAITVFYDRSSKRWKFTSTAEVKDIVQ